MTTSIEQHIRKAEEELAAASRNACSACRGNQLQIVWGDEPAEPCPACGATPQLVVCITDREDGPQ